jgi:hypothetical protein
MTWLESMPGLTTFRATLRRTGSTCSATKTQPEAAFADLLHELVGADLRADRFGDRGVVGGGHSRRRTKQDGGWLLVGGQQPFHGGTQLRVLAGVD